MDRVEHGTSNRGEQHPLGRLTEKQVKEIRSKIKRGSRGVDIAREYGIASSHVSNIKHRSVWKWLS